MSVIITTEHLYLPTRHIQPLLLSLQTPANANNFQFLLKTIPVQMYPPPPATHQKHVIFRFLPDHPNAVRRADMAVTMTAQDSQDEILHRVQRHFAPNPDIDCIILHNQYGQEIILNYATLHDQEIINVRVIHISKKITFRGPQTAPLVVWITPSDKTKSIFQMVKLRWACNPQLDGVQLKGETGSIIIPSYQNLDHGQTIIVEIVPESMAPPPDPSIEPVVYQPARPADIRAKNIRTIEANWKRILALCLPIHAYPRVRTNRKVIRAAGNPPTLAPKEWPGSLVEELAEISKVTPGRYAIAKELMEEVRTRRLAIAESQINSPEILPEDIAEARARIERVDREVLGEIEDLMDLSDGEEASDNAQDRRENSIRLLNLLKEMVPGVVFQPPHIGGYNNLPLFIPPEWKEPGGYCSMQPKEAAELLEDVEKYPKGPEEVTDYELIANIQVRFGCAIDTVLPRKPIDIRPEERVKISEDSSLYLKRPMVCSSWPRALIRHIHALSLLLRGNPAKAGEWLVAQVKKRQENGRPKTPQVRVGDVLSLIKLIVERAQQEERQT